MDCCGNALPAESGAEDFRLRKNKECAGGKRDTVRNAFTIIVQAQKPSLCGERSGQRNTTHRQDAQRQRASEYGCYQSVKKKIVQAKPQSHTGEELCIAAADIAQREKREAHSKTDKASQQMYSERACAHWMDDEQQCEPGE